MADVRLSVGTQLSVAVGVPSPYTMSEFSGLSWVTVGEVESMGEFGGSAQITNFIPLDTGIVKKRKGSIDYGTASLVIGRVEGNTGQGVLKEGFDGAQRNAVHSFRAVDDDGNVAYFTGMIGQFQTRIGDANTVTAVLCNIELDNRVLSDVYGDVFLVQFVAGANGSIIGATHQVVEDGGDTTFVYAAPDSGYAFTQWDDTNTDNPRQLTNVTQAETLTATFALE